MRKLIERRLLQYFGLTEQPMYWSDTMEQYKLDIVYAIQNNQMLTISGTIGSGKSILFSTALGTMDNITPVVVRNYYKEKVQINSILNAAIYDISNEEPRRDLEARSRQFIRLVGKRVVAEKSQVCIIIEEAHRLNAKTLVALKELREAEFNGKTPLFSIILIGHEELQAKLESRKEAYWRAQILELNESSGWMTLQERRKYVKYIYKNAVTPEAIERIIAMNKTPLAMDFYIQGKMAEARKAGIKVLDSNVVKPTAKEVYEANKHLVSQREIAKEINMSVTTVNNAINTKESEYSDVVIAAIAKLSIKKAV